MTTIYRVLGLHVMASASSTVNCPVVSIAIGTSSKSFMLDESAMG